VFAAFSASGVTGSLRWQQQELVSAVGLPWVLHLSEDESSSRGPTPDDKCLHTCRVQQYEVIRFVDYFQFSWPHPSWASHTDCPNHTGVVLCLLTIVVFVAEGWRLRNNTPVFSNTSCLMPFVVRSARVLSIQSVISSPHRLLGLPLLLAPCNLSVFLRLTVYRGLNMQKFAMPPKFLAHKTRDRGIMRLCARIILLSL